MERQKPSSDAIALWGGLVAGAASALIGAHWLVAWLSGAAARWSAAGDSITVKTNTALGLFLAGAALLLVVLRPDAAWARWTVRVASATVLLIGALTLSQHLFGWNLGIDQLLVEEAPGALAVTSPNRPGPPASFSFTLLGIALLLLESGRRSLVPYLALAVTFISLVPLLGFLYGIEEFFSMARITGIAWPTVLAMLSLGLGLVLICVEHGPMRLLLRDDAGGVLLRQMLPLVVLAPIILTFLVIQGGMRRLYPIDTGSGLLVISFIVLFCAMLWRSAARLSRANRQRAQSADALRRVAQFPQENPQPVLASTPQARSCTPTAPAPNCSTMPSAKPDAPHRPFWRRRRPKPCAAAP